MIAVYCEITDAIHEDIRSKVEHAIDRGVLLEVYCMVCNYTWINTIGVKK